MFRLIIKYLNDAISQSLEYHKRKFLRVYRHEGAQVECSTCLLYCVFPSRAADGHHLGQRYFLWKAGNRREYLWTDIGVCRSRSRIADSGDYKERGDDLGWRMGCHRGDCDAAVWCYGIIQRETGFD